MWALKNFGPYLRNGNQNFGWGPRRPGEVDQFQKGTFLVGPPTELPCQIWRTPVDRFDRGILRKIWRKKKGEKGKRRLPANQYRPLYTMYIGAYKN